jgi:hypothetical protein
MKTEIEKLKAFFGVSNAFFEIQNNIQLAMGGHVMPNKMQQLHKIALVEIEKENPDLSLIDKLLDEMIQENTRLINAEIDKQKKYLQIKK